MFAKQDPNQNSKQSNENNGQPQINNNFAQQNNYQAYENGYGKNNLHQQFQDLNYSQQPQINSDHQQAFDIEPLIEAQKSLDSLSFDERKGFIIKVYSIISIQLLITVAITIQAYQNQSWRNYFVHPDGKLTAFTWVCFVVNFITECAILCCKRFSRKVPNNYIALAIFTFTMSVIVAAICSCVYNKLGEKGGFLVMAAAALTLAVAISLTIYAITTKSDFTMMGGAIWIISSVILICCIISFFNRSKILQLVICGLVIIIYGFYLIYDTQLIIGGKQHELSIDDYIIAALLIYVDIILLFLRILEIFQAFCD